MHNSLFYGKVVFYMEKQNKKIGFIGQGWIGKNYADDFEKRGFEVVRYAQEEPYIKNKEAITDCDIVFIAVPTPSTPEGFDDSILREVIKLVGKGKTAVVKSTLLPGTTESIQEENPDVFVMHSPEFLTASTAAHDAANPDRNIIGISVDNDVYRKNAEEVLAVLPEAPYKKICSAKEAEFVKYGGNCLSYFKIIFINLMYDLTQSKDTNWDTIQEAMAADPRIGPTHLSPVHQGGRGAGNYCFIKDFAAFTELYKKEVSDKHGMEILEALKNKNNELLVQSGKDLELLEGVYGKIEKN